MPAPLFWLGALALGAYSANKANTAYLKNNNVVDSMPGDSDLRTMPKNGSVVCCGIYGVLDHTGIWVDGNIFELAGSGLVRCVSPNRFVGERSGSKIYVACNTKNKALHETNAVLRARERLYSVVDYNVLSRNCHRFVAEMLSGTEQDITSFSDLNEFLSAYYQQSIRWNLLHTRATNTARLGAS